MVMLAPSQGRAEQRAHHAVGGQVHRRLLAGRALVQREEAGVHQVELGLVGRGGEGMGLVDASGRATGGCVGSKCQGA